MVAIRCFATLFWFGALNVREVMTKLGTLTICVAVFCCLLEPVNAQERPVGTDAGRIPVTGRKTSGVEAIDRVMLKYLDKIGCSAATMAIAHKGVLIHSRGYGWSDQARTVPTQPNTMIGIASCEKPVTAAAIRQLARKRRLDLDAGVFKLLQIVPAGKVVDERIWKITIRNLLDHKAGWQGKPLEAAAEAARRSGHQGSLPVPVLLTYVMVEMLKDDPGTKYDYCNFCYDTLRYILEKVSGQKPVDYFRTTLFGRSDKTEFKGFEAPNAHGRKGDPPLVWNDGGPVSASAPVLCAFMHRFWLTGEPRSSGNPYWQKNGGLPGSTAMMLWRPDGTDMVFIFNGRGNASHEEIKQELEQALAQTKRFQNR
jgi:CubicO group peptidase (beta-lactamase class C family)